MTYNSVVMAKSRGLQKEELKQYLRRAYEGAKLCRNPINAHSYNINIMLTDMEVRFAIMYEVARRLNLSLLQVAEQYNLINYSLYTNKLVVVSKGLVINKTMPVNAIVTHVLRAAANHNPTIILLNVSGAHWVPVIIKQNLENTQLLVQTINSSLDPMLHPSELKNFVKAIVDEANETGLSIIQEDESREVQIANVCGLASAHACGIVMTCLQSKLPVRATLLNAEANRLRNNDSNSMTIMEISYCVQGRRTFAVMEYLYQDFERVDTNIHTVERIALVKCGFLDKMQANSRVFKVDHFLTERETLRFKEPTEETSYRANSKRSRYTSANSDDENLSKVELPGIATQSCSKKPKNHIKELASEVRKEPCYNPPIGTGASLDAFDMYGTTALGLSIAQENLHAIKTLLLNSAIIQREHFTRPLQTWATRLLTSLSLWTPPELSPVETILCAYKADPIKWLKDNGASQAQVEKYHRLNPQSAGSSYLNAVTRCIMGSL